MTKEENAQFLDGNKSKRFRRAVYRPRITVHRKV
jgi:hypothetical protein